MRRSTSTLPSQGNVALGINIDEVPFPLGTALEGGRIPRCIPSRPWKLHDPRVFGAPWWRKKTHPSARSEQGLPWTPVPPSYPPPSALQPSGATKSNAPYPPQSTARPKPTQKPAPKPPVESKKETEKKVAENQEKIKAAKEKGFPIMPKAENSTTFTVTDRVGLILWNSTMVRLQTSFRNCVLGILR